MRGGGGSGTGLFVHWGEPCNGCDPVAWLRGGGGGPGTLVEESFITNDYIEEAVEEAVDEEEDVIVASDETELLEHSCPFPPSLPHSAVVQRVSEVGKTLA